MTCEVDVVGCPGAVCILMLILLPQEGLPLMRGPLQARVILWEPSPHFLTGKIKAKAVSFREGGKGRGWRKRKPAWTRTSWPGETACNKGHHSWRITDVALDLSNLGVWLINKISGLCVSLKLAYLRL